MSKYSHIRHWIDDLPKMGRSSFSLDEVRELFPQKSPESVRNALHRLSLAGKIRSPWRSFYAIVLPEYGLNGDVPSVEYIDQLMSYVNADYYVGLLSAAAFQGAAHQAPQVFQVISDRRMQSAKANSNGLEFTFKKAISQNAIVGMPVKSGVINVSAPAMTALDLVSYSTKAGGISNTTTVLSDLVEQIDFSIFDAQVLKRESRASIQRLGHLLGTALGEKNLAENLFEACVDAELSFRREELVPGSVGAPLSCDSKWKIAVNYEVEVDE